MPEMPTSQSPRPITCIWCSKKYVPHPNWHHKTGLCSRICKLARHNKIAAAYKKTAKGIEAEKRWRLNPQKKRIDRQYAHTEAARIKAVEKAARYKERHHERVVRESNRLARLRRRFRFSKSPELEPWRKWWREHAAKGCAVCGSTKRLNIDHIVPRIKGGTDDFDNLQILCKVHNGEKGYGRKRESRIWKK